MEKRKEYLSLSLQTYFNSSKLFLKKGKNAKVLFFYSFYFLEIYFAKCGERERERERQTDRQTEERERI